VSFFKGQEELNLTEGGIVKPLLFLRYRSSSRT